MRLTLLEYYREEQARLKGQEKKRMRLHWHNAAKRCLIAMSLTSDPLPPLHTDYTDPECPVTTTPFYRFFYLRPNADIELRALYRATSWRGNT